MYKQESMFENLKEYENKPVPVSAPIPTPTWVERSEKEEIDYHTLRYTIHNDVLLLGYDNMTITEKKIVRLVVANVQKNPGRSEFPIFQTTITELAEVLECPAKSLYNEINRISNDLMDRKLYIRYENSPDKWEKFHWIGWTGYDNGVFSIKLSEEIKNFFLDLKGNFTIFEHLDYIMGSKCSYTVDISEALAALVKRDPVKRSQFQSGQTVKVNIALTRFREITSTIEKYKEFHDLKKRVITPAVKEMNEISDIYIEDVKYDRKGSSRKVNSIVFYLHNKENRKKQYNKVEVQSFNIDNEDTLDEGYLKKQLETSGVFCHPDQLKELLKRYKTVHEFMEDFTKATQNADHNVVSYLLAIARNKEKTANRVKKNSSSDWDTLDLKEEFLEIIDYWNNKATQQEVEFDMAGVTEGYSLKKILRQDRRVRENYFKLKEEGETKESVMAAIDVASRSQYFLRISGTFSFFLNPKNYFDIASGDRDYDSEAVKLWKETR